MGVILSKVSVWVVKLKNGIETKVATIEQEPRKKSMCDGCQAPCCRGMFKPILNKDEFINRKFRFEYTETPSWLRNQIPDVPFVATLAITKLGCPYHEGKTNKCSVWPECPKSCLAYDCREDERSYIKNFAIRRSKKWKE